LQIFGRLSVPQGTSVMKKHIRSITSQPQQNENKVAIITTVTAWWVLLLKLG
jgi:hypothetical protein